jgi:hypothetical protein
MDIIHSLDFYLELDVSETDSYSDGTYSLERTYLVYPPRQS